MAGDMQSRFITDKRGRPLNLVKSEEAFVERGG